MPADNAATTPSSMVEHETATVTKARDLVAGGKSHSDALIALGRLAAWAEAGLTPRFAIRVIPTEESEDDLDLRY